jgi:hypothetical protein
MVDKQEDFIIPTKKSVLERIKDLKDEAKRKYNEAKTERVNSKRIYEAVYRKEKQKQNIKLAKARAEIEAREKLSRYKQVARKGVVIATLQRGREFVNDLTNNPYTNRNKNKNKNRNKNKYKKFVQGNNSSSNKNTSPPMFQ